MRRRRFLILLAMPAAAAAQACDPDFLRKWNRFAHDANQRVHEVETTRDDRLTKKVHEEFRAVEASPCW